MRFPNQRLAQLFTLLQNETLPQDELAQRLSVSTRTVRADITALNALLVEYGAQFMLTRGSGYQLKIDDPALPDSARACAEAAADSAYGGGSHQLSAGALFDLCVLHQARRSGGRVVCQPGDVTKRYGRSARALSALSADSRDPPTARYEAVWQRSIDSRLPDRSVMATGAAGGINPLIDEEALNSDVQEQLGDMLQEILTRHHVRLTDEGERFIRMYSAVTVRRVSQGYPLAEFSAEDVAQNVRDAARDLAACCSSWRERPSLRQKKRGCACILPPVRFRTSIRAPSAPTMAKRW
jgi:biotin operon repressor